MQNIALNEVRKYSWGATAAQIAVMPKVILITHSLYKNQKLFSDSIYEKSIVWNK